MSAHRGRAHRGRQLQTPTVDRGRQLQTPTEGEMPRWGGIEHRREILERPPRARIAARCGKQLPARCGELHSGAEPLTPTVGDGEALTRDGPRRSRHASEERRILGTPLKHGEASTCDSPQKDSENEQLQAAGRAHRGRIRSTSSSDSAHRGRAAVQRARRAADSAHRGRAAVALSR